MFLDSRSHPRGKRSHGRDRGCGHGGRDYELLAHYAALSGGQGDQYGYERQGQVQLDGVPLLRKRRGPRGGMLDRLGGELLGVQRREIGGMNGEFIGEHGGLGLGGGLGGHHGGTPAVHGIHGVSGLPGLGGFGPLDGGGGHMHGLGGGIDFLGQPHGSQQHYHHGMAGFGGHRFVPGLRSRMRAARGVPGMEIFDGAHSSNHGRHGHSHQHWFGGHQSGAGLEDTFAAMGLGDHRRPSHHQYHQHGHVHPMPPVGHHNAHHSTAQAEASHGNENIGRAGHGPNDPERPASRTPPGSHHNSRADSQSFDMHAMDRPRMPYHYRHPYVEEAEGASEADLQADLQRRAALGEMFPESGHWYDSSLMDLYYI